jgi:acyl carrier protein
MRGEINMNSIQDQLKNYILSEFMYEDNKKSLEPEDDLLSQGVIDSMGILQIVNFMEEKFGISVIDEEIIPENFRTLNALTNFVVRKNATQQAA